MERACEETLFPAFWAPKATVFVFRTSGSEGRDPRGPDFLKEFKWENEDFWENFPVGNFGAKK